MRALRIGADISVQLQVNNGWPAIQRHPLRTVLRCTMPLSSKDFAKGALSRFRRRLRLDMVSSLDELDTGKCFADSKIFSKVDLLNRRCTGCRDHWVKCGIFHGGSKHLKCGIVLLYFYCCILRNFGWRPCDSFGRSFSFTASLCCSAPAGAERSRYPSLQSCA